MKWLNRVFRIVLPLIVMCKFDALRSEEQTNGPRQVPGSTKQNYNAPVAWERRMKEIRWDGLPLSEIVNELRREFPEINFVVTRKVQSESVSVILRNVTLAELFKALEPATEGRIKVTSNPEDDGRLIVFDAPPRLPSDPSICRAFNLSGFLATKEGKDADMELRTVTEALQQGWTMLREANGNDSESMPRLSVHKGANLLIVVARPFEMTVAEEVIKELQGSASATKIALPPEPEHEKKSKTATNAPAPKP